MIYQFGVTPHASGVTFRVWAPRQSAVAVVLEGGAHDRHEIQMRPERDGFFVADVPAIGAGQRYWLRLSTGLRPDPASRSQPDGPLAASQVVDATQFQWTDHRWPGALPRHRHVIYEMHIGTFTREGTWAGAIARLPDLADIGVTTLEVMPVAEFPGGFGWGYDGVNLFAPSHLYGTPDEMRAFVDAAHAVGLAVILDVVYNHFGPVGNYLADFTDSIHGSPGEWGDLINYDGIGSGPVRALITENAGYWIREFHLDGLRIDATQAMHDRSPQHIISEVCRAARGAAGTRTLFLVGESEPQESALLKQSGVYADGLDAIWNEDFHHAAFVALTGRRTAYFSDYRGSAHEFAAMARHGFLYHGQYYTWQKNTRGGYALGLPGSCFVSFLENHDQVANTGDGRRLYERVDQARWRALTAWLLLGPQLPMLFQGQEFGSTSPFIYFADHEAELAATVEQGRRVFLSQFPNLRDTEMQRVLPSPTSYPLVERCTLQDAERHSNGPLTRLHRDLLRLRREDAVITAAGTDEVQVESSAPAPAIALLRYLRADEHRLLVCNIGDDHMSPMNDPLLAPLRGSRWEQLWSSDHPAYGGLGSTRLDLTAQWLIPAGSTTLLATRPVTTR